MTVENLAGVSVARRQHAVCQFLYREARLADAGDYAGWLQVWAPGEIVYWVAPHDALDPSQEVSYVYDNRDRLEQRVARWRSGFAWAQVPRSETNRLVGNVEIVVAADGHGVTASANVQIVVARKGRTDLVTERVTYQLQEADDSYLIVQKKVVLLGGEAPVGNITFVL